MITRPLLAFGLVVLASIGQTSDLSRLDWLAGCWLGAGGVEEHWMKPAGGTMLGMSRTVRQEKTAAFEFLRIHRDVNGDIHFVARPSGQPEASFKLLKMSEREVIFENPAHDFPQRIIYPLAPDGSLFARIEGVRNGKEAGVDFPMKRAQCQ